MYEASLEEKVFAIKIRIDRFKHKNGYLFTETTDKDKAVLVYDEKQPRFVLKEKIGKDE